MRAPTCKTLRCHATARSLPTWDSTIEAVTHLGFVQADPIRAPARAQDLILRQRVKDYRVGDLERQYPQLPLWEDMLHVYGFLPQQHVPLLHPRQLSSHWSEFLSGRAALRKSVLRLVQQLGTAHPREVEKELGGATCESGWGQRTSETRMMLEVLHLTGLLRVARRESGQRVYACVSTDERLRPLTAWARAEGLCRLLVSLYAPMPARSLRQVLGAVRGPVTATPKAALERLCKKGELRCERIDGEEWIWPEAETAALLVADAEEARVRLLAPFDPVVWDRRRFALLWGWEYRFEAYTPAAKRQLGYYALPLLYRAQVIGWANLQVREGTLAAELGFVGTQPREAAFRRGLEQELAALQDFLQSPQENRDRETEPGAA